jgi:hypothetical protein
VVVVVGAAEVVVVLCVLLWPRHRGLGVVVFCYWLFKGWLGLFGRGQWCVGVLGEYVRVGVVYSGMATVACFVAVF